MLTRVLATASPRLRLVVSADRGFADVGLCDLLDSFKIAYILRVKCSTKVYWQGTWCSLSQIGFVGHSRHRELGRILYCASSPHRLWLTLSRQRNKAGEWEVWCLLSNRKRSAARWRRVRSSWAAMKASAMPNGGWDFAAARITDLSGIFSPACSSW